MLRPWIPTDLTNDGTEIIWLVADDKENVYSQDGTRCIEIKNKGNYGGNAVMAANRTTYAYTNAVTLNNRKVLKSGDTNASSAVYRVDNTRSFSSDITGWTACLVWKQAKLLDATSTGSATRYVSTIGIPVEDYGSMQMFELSEIEYGENRTDTVKGVIRTNNCFRKDGHWSSYHQLLINNNTYFPSQEATSQPASWMLMIDGFDFSSKTFYTCCGPGYKGGGFSGQYTDYWNKTGKNEAINDIGIMGAMASRTTGAVGGYGAGICLAEAVYIRKPLDFDNFVIMQGYLAHEWGLTDQLPDGHPYKTERPMIDDTNIGTYVRKVCDDITTVFEVAWSGSSNENGIYIIKQKELDLSTLQKPIYHGVQVEGNWVLVIDGLTVDENMSKITTTVRFECPDKTYVVKQKQLTVNLTWS